MNISEEEKNEIRGLHKNYSIIKEQSRDAVFVDGQKAILDKLAIGAQSLREFVNNEYKPYGEGFRDLTEIQTYVNEKIDAYVEITKQARAKMGYEG